MPDPANTGICFSCITGYYPQPQGGCKMVSVFCDAYNLENGQCLTCRYGFTPTNGECVDPNCMTQTEEGCLECKSGWKTNSMKYCEYSDPNCLNAAPTRCLDCNPGFFVNLQGNCLLLPPNCVAANIQTEACIQCEQGYEVNGGACVLKAVPIAPPPPTPIPNCAQQNGAICSSCFSEFQLINNQCFPLLPNCLQLVPTSPNFCRVCATGYEVEAGICKKLQTPSTPFCASYDLITGICKNCISGY